MASRGAHPSARAQQAADIEAAMRADKCLDSGDMEGEAAWLRIVKAIDVLTRRDRQIDQELH